MPFDIYASMVHFYSILSARYFYIFTAFGDGVIYKVPAKIFIVDINLNLSFYTRKPYCPARRTRLECKHCCHKSNNNGGKFP